MQDRIIYRNVPLALCSLLRSLLCSPLHSLLCFPLCFPLRSRLWSSCSLLCSLLIVATIAQGAPDLAGRWEGVAEIPGAPQRLVLDIARDPQKKWTGSVILPGLGTKGAPAADLAVTGESVRFGLPAAFAIPSAPAPEVHLARRADGALIGELREGGNRAPLLLKRTGAPQVDAVPASTAISAALEGTWVGRYELGGYARDVTVTLVNHPAGAGGGASAGGEIIVVGKRTTTLPIDRVVQGAEFIALQSTAFGFRIEGRWATPDGIIQGQMIQGPFEAPLVLRRVPSSQNRSQGSSQDALHDMSQEKSQEESHRTSQQTSQEKSQ